MKKNRVLCLRAQRNTCISYYIRKKDFPQPFKINTRFVRIPNFVIQNANSFSKTKQEILFLYSFRVYSAMLAGEEEG